MIDRALRIIGMIGAALIFIFFVALVVIGQRTTSWGSLGIQLIGLAGVLGMLAFYNHQYR